MAKRPGLGRPSPWYSDGYDAGAEAAVDNLADPPSRADLERAFEREAVGEIAGEIREHQSQFAGDLSYDVGRRGGPTERQFELWEEGFTAGFIATVEAELGEDEEDEKPSGAVNPDGRPQEPDSHGDTSI